MKYPRGSEWRKWDLQVQTILDDNYTSIENYLDAIKSNTLDKYNELVARIGSENLIKKYDSKNYFFTNSTDNEKQRAKNYAKLFLNYIDIFNNDVGGIGVTDHNYEHLCLLDCLVDESKKYDFNIIPGVEINIQGVHVLIYFDKKPYGKSTYSEGVKTFLNKINITNRKTNGVLSVCNKSYTDVINEVREIGAILIYSHCNTPNGLFQERGRTDRTHLADQFNYQTFNILQSKNKESADSVTVYINSRSELKSEHVFTLGSDARSLNKILSPDKDGNYCWIKADPTFEGLKQIIFEPQERIRLQVASPKTDYIKPYFSKIKLKREKLFADEEVMFANDEIELNPNFVAIIGGRGTGKSLLLDAIAKTFSQVDNKARAAGMTTSSDFVVSYTKEDGSVMDYSRDGTEFLDYLHVSQGSVRDIVNEAEILDSEIKRMLEIQKSFKESESDYSYRLNIDERFKLKKWFEVQNENGEYINSREYNLTIKEKNQKLIDTITTPKNKEFIEKYCKNKSEIDLYEKRKIFLADLKTKITDELDALNSEIEEINKVSDPKLGIPIFNFETQEKAIERLTEDYTDKISALQKNNKEIEQNLKEKGITGDLTTLLEKISDYQDEIDEAKKRIEKYDKNIERLRVLVTERIGFADKICNDISAQKQKIRDGWDALKKGKEGWSGEQSEIIKELLQHIEIDGRISFNVDMFYKEARKFINEVKFKETKSQSILDRIKDLLNVNNYDSFVKLIKNEKIIKYEGTHISLEELLDTECFVKQGDRDFLELLFFNNHRAKYLKVITDIKYLGKAVNKLSVGQRGTLYLCLKLATEAFFTPFVFDQPEDDLDNPFIMEQLVPIFKKIKKYRQVIIVTHNANLVVNTDAEQVIVADNEEEILFYTSGALENVEPVSGKSTFLNGKWIKKLICDVLEGGRPAFEQREKKYGFTLVK